MIPYGRQDINQTDINAVIEVLKSDWVTQGPAITRFEQAVADYSGSSHAVAVNSATSALHLACLALGLGSGDYLWTTPNTFVASANCGLYCGASIDFVDIDPRSYNMSTAALETKLKQAEKQGKLPKIVVPVHFSGQPCEMRKIRQLSKHYGFFVIEDASHAIGAKYQGEPVGNCRYSDITVFSFHPVKIITTGEGGMALTNSKKLADKLQRLRSHGITRDPEIMTYPSNEPWYYQQIELGFNYRITDIQAALGLSQLERLDQFIEQRHRLANRYDKMLENLPLITPWRDPDSYSAFHLYVICLKPAEVDVTRLEVFESMRAAGIGVNVHYIPVHTQPYYRKLGFENGDFPEAENYYSRAITLPLYPQLTGAQQDKVTQTLQQAIR